MVGLPSGTVTFLFTDLEKSTRLWEEQPAAMSKALARHDSILRDAIAAHAGHLVKSTGDGVFAVFADASDAVDAAVAAQLALGAEDWTVPEPLRVRMGIHSGPAELRDGDYFGNAVNRAARLMSAAHGGQVVISQATEAVLPEVLAAGLELVDLGQQRLADLSRPERVFQVAHEGLGRVFPRLRSLDALPGNLPVQVTSFVGRDDDLARITAMLREARLITLTGVGGIGKTRLAMQVAGATSPEFSDGAWVCELAGVHDAEALADSVFAIFELPPRRGVAGADALIEFLRAKDMLLVLDNCEHLVESVASLVGQIERVCPGVRMLATSREALNVAGEHVLVVSSLSLPGDNAPFDVAEDCDSVRLFVERARAVKADFVLDATNAEAVSQICRRLDGIALAIELAAARVPMLTPAELARHLDHRFRVLSGGRTAVARHQTLRAAIDWSYALLSEREQRVLDRLSVFAGGFALVAVEAVTADAGLDADEIFEILAALVARSLVGADTEAAEARYTLLETIRQYAQERLASTGDTERVRAAHAAYFATFADSVAAGLVGPNAFEWMARAEPELENVRTALAWAVETRDADVGLRLLRVYLPPNWLVADLGWAFRAGTEATLAIPGASQHPGYSSALVVAGYLEFQRGDHDLASRHCDEALAVAQRLGREPEPNLWQVKSVIAQAAGDLDEAIEHAARAVTLYRSRGATVRLMFGLTQVSVLRAFAGDTGMEAVLEVDEARALADQVGDPVQMANVLGLGAFVLREAQPERALIFAREAVDLAGPLKLGQAPLAWAGPAEVAALRGDHHDALAYAARAMDEFHWSGTRPLLGATLRRIGDHLARDDPESATVLYGAGDAFAPTHAMSPRPAEEHQRAIAATHAALGEQRHYALYTRGKAMDPDGAVTYAHAAINRALGR